MNSVKDGLEYSVAEEKARVARDITTALDTATLPFNVAKNGVTKGTDELLGVVVGLV